MTNFESSTPSQPPERIYGWLNSQLSLARHNGRAIYRGVVYEIDRAADGQPLVRADVLEREKLEKDKLRRFAATIDKQTKQGGLF